MLYLLAVTIVQPQAVEPPAALPLSATPPANALAPPAATCAKSDNVGEVVVCGDRDADKKYRLQTVDPTLYGDAPIRAETKIAGGVLGVTANRVMVGGVPSNRLMLNFKIKF